MNNSKNCIPILWAYDDLKIAILQYHSFFVGKQGRRHCLLKLKETLFYLCKIIKIKLYSQEFPPEEFLSYHGAFFFRKGEIF
jgi:hypothetical protein